MIVNVQPLPIKYFLIEIFSYKRRDFIDDEPHWVTDDDESSLENADSEFEFGLDHECIECAPCEDTAKSQMARNLGYSSIIELIDVECASGEFSLSIKVTEVSQQYARAFEMEKKYG
jgi:hypothetical protein